jgi:hydrogenase nickel incorporation protein HypA/HybF
MKARFWRGPRRSRGNRDEAPAPRRDRDRDDGDRPADADPAVPESQERARAVRELGIAGAVLRAVERRAAGRQVRRARVRAGALLRISGPALNQAFVTVSDGTVADGARLDVVIEPARVGCRSCGRTTTSDRMPARCPGCGGTGIDLQSGDGLVLELVEFDDAERRAGREPTA